MASKKKVPIEKSSNSKNDVSNMLEKQDDGLYTAYQQLANGFTTELFDDNEDESSRGNDYCIMCNNITKLRVQELPICYECQSKFSMQLKYANDYNGIPKLVNGVRLMLEGLKDLYNIDPTDDNFRDTPKRVARLMMEMNYGNNLQAAKDVLNVSFPTDNMYGGLVSSNNIHVSSTCPHHLVVVDYNVSLAYVPNNGRYIGLSKLPRLARTLAKSMCLQEDYTKKLVDVLDSELKPMGCAAMVTGIHNCIQARGAEMRDVQNTTIELRGIFQYNPSLKEEWLFTIKNSAHHD